MEKCKKIREVLRSYSLAVAVFFCMTGCAQPDVNETDRSIAEIRKGELTVKANKGDKIIIEQLRHQFWFGCAISNNPFSDGSMAESDIRQFKEKFLANFNAAVTENAVKWGNMEREKGRVNYAIVDAILHWTTENDIPLRAHNVFWGIPNYVQSWLKELNDQDLEQTLKNRAETLSTRYKGRFAEYDLNNEMIHGNYYEDRLGPDITKKMAEWMHNGDPDANLYLNDYDIATGNKLNEYMAQIRTLLQQGVPIAGIGVQGHLHAETFDRYELQRALDSLAQFNLPICITEFNMPGQRSKHMKDRSLKMTAEEEEQNATELVDYYRICFAHPAVKGIIMWGFWEKANWIPVSSMYRADWTPTPTADAYRDLIFNEWWTNVSGKADRKGIFSTSAFYGKYKISAGNVTKIVDFDKASGSMTVDFTNDNTLSYITPESKGVPSEAISAFMDELKRDNLNMHSFMLIKDEKILAECYWPYFNAKKKHRMYSVSKSFTSVAIGMMIDEGRISLDDKVADFFPEYLPPNPHPFILQATIRHLLMMATFNPSTSYNQYDADWVATFFQDPREKHEPGKKFSYDTAATVVLCAIVEKLNGKSILEYMRPVLDEIGISQDIWCIRSPDGRSWTGSGIMATTHDFARFGLLCLNRGAWNGKQLISREYMEAATSSQIDNGTQNGTEFRFGYGFQFWCLRDGGFACYGMGGQLALCLPSKNLLLITTADNQAYQNGIMPIVEAFFRLAGKTEAKALPENPEALKFLADQIANVSTPLPNGTTTTPHAAQYSGARYEMGENNMGIKWIRLDITSEKCTLRYENSTGEHHIILGMGKYIYQKFPEKYFGAQIGIRDTNYDAIAAGAWQDNNTLTGIIYSIDDHLGSIHLTLSFSADQLQVTMTKAAEWFFDSYRGSMSGKLVNK